MRHSLLHIWSCCHFYILALITLSCRHSACITMLYHYISCILCLPHMFQPLASIWMLWDCLLRWPSEGLGKYNLTISINSTIIARRKGKRFFQHIMSIKMRMFWGECQDINICLVCEEGHCFKEVLCVLHGTYTDNVLLFSRYTTAGDAIVTFCGCFGLP